MMHYCSTYASGFPSKPPKTMNDVAIAPNVQGATEAVHLG